MKDITFETVSNHEDGSFLVKNYQHDFFEAPLHIHSQYELISFDKGEGAAFVGDSINRFRPDDLMLIGERLPHLWMSDDIYYEENNGHTSASTYAQFTDKILPRDISILPEFTSIESLLNRSQRGIIFHGKKKDELQDLFRRIPHQSNFAKLIYFYYILNELAQCEFEYLTTEQYINPMLKYVDNTILTNIHTFIADKYREDITLKEIAEYAGMSPSAMCRYFKNHTGRTIFEHLAETRISYAIKLLSSRKISIGAIAYDCGYNNISHFNRQFKAITGKAPSQYKELIGL